MIAPREKRLLSAAAVGLLAAAAAALSVPIEASESGVPVAGCTCHNDNPSTEVVVTVDGWPLIYTPGEAYPLVITGTGPVVGVKGGFSVDVTKGTLSSTDPVVAASGNHATHIASDERSWPLLWIAPGEDSGNVRITAYVNLVNGDDTDGPEDLWNVFTATAAEKAPEPPKPSTMALAYAGPGEAGVAGRNFTVEALLVNSTGAPIPNAALEFSAHLSFGTLPLGKNTTDANGTARMNWTVPAPGDFVLHVYYDGSSKNLSSNATVVVTVTDPDGVWTRIYGGQEKGVWGWFDPVRVPLFLLVGGVWATFAYSMVDVLRARSRGRARDDGPRALLALLVPQQGVLRRRKNDKKNEP